MLRWEFIGLINRKKEIKVKNTKPLLGVESTPPQQQQQNVRIPTTSTIECDLIEEKFHWKCN